MILVLLNLLKKIHRFNNYVKKAFLLVFLKKRGFRFTAKSVFLTYSQCRLTPEELYKELSKKARIDSCLIRQELHEKESRRRKHKGLHLHALIKYEKKLDTTSSLFFDVEDCYGETYHPHIKKTKATKVDIKKIEDYLLKDYTLVFSRGNAFAKPLDENQVFTREGVAVNKKNLIEVCLDLASRGLIQESILIINKVDIKIFLRRNSSLEKSFKKHYELNNPNVMVPRYHLIVFKKE